MSREILGFHLDEGPVLVTGAGGFVGRSVMNMFRMGPGDVATDVNCDFPAPEGVRKIRWVLPGKPAEDPGPVRYLIHLAGLSSAAQSENAEDIYHRVNALGTGSVIEWMESRSPYSRMLFVSSAEVYSPTDMILQESSPAEPINPYGQSKLAAEKAVSESGAEWIISRSFPHYGPGQQMNFVLPSFCRRIINASRNGDRTIPVGNLSACRDYLYIDDVVRAYACLLAKGRQGAIYNVCSGEGHSISELLEKLLTISGHQARAVTDECFLRRKDQQIQIGDPCLLKELGWKADVSLEKGLGLLYRWWEERL